SLGGTVRARLAALGVVAACRVVLMGRVLTVLLNDHTPGALCFVLMVADAVALMALWVTSTPTPAQTTPRVLSRMGGISPHVSDKKQDEFVTRVATRVGCAGVL